MPWLQPEGKSIMTPDTVSYMMLFCALILVRNDRASLEQSLILAPLAGPAKDLAEAITAGVRC